MIETTRRCDRCKTEITEHSEFVNFRDNTQSYDFHRNCLNEVTMAEFVEMLLMGSNLSITKHNWRLLVP